MTKASATDVSELVRAAASVRSLCQLDEKAQQLTAPSAVSHDLPMTLGKTMLSLVRSRVVAQLERYGCPILYTLVPEFQLFPDKN